MAAVQGRYSVTYRLVNSVYAMVVAPPGANVFLAMQLVDAVAKVLVGVSRGVDVTPDKLVKRYTEVGGWQVQGRVAQAVKLAGRLDGWRVPAAGMAEAIRPAGWKAVVQHCTAMRRPCSPHHCSSPNPAPAPPPAAQVYMLLEDLVATCLSTLPPAFMHSSATDERLLVLPASAADAARRLKRMVRGGGGRGASSFVAGKEGGGEEGGAGDPTPPPVPETPTSRGGQQFSAAHADPLGAVAFDIPPDALPPPPARAAVARRQPGPGLAAPQRPTPPPPAFKGAVDEGAVKAAEADAEGFGAFGEVAMLGALGCCWLAATQQSERGLGMSHQGAAVSCPVCVHAGCAC